MNEHNVPLRRTHPQRTIKRTGPSHRPDNNSSLSPRDMRSHNVPSQIPNLPNTPDIPNIPDIANNIPDIHNAPTSHSLTRRHPQTRGRRDRTHRIPHPLQPNTRRQPRTKPLHTIKNPLRIIVQQAILHRRYPPRASKATHQSPAQQQIVRTHQDRGPLRMPHPATTPDGSGQQIHSNLVANAKPKPSPSPKPLTTLPLRPPLPQPPQPPLNPPNRPLRKAMRRQHIHQPPRRRLRRTNHPPKKPGQHTGSSRVRPSSHPQLCGKTLRRHGSLHGIRSPAGRCIEELFEPASHPRLPPRPRPDPSAESDTV
ncbi:hypothetical protein GCM10009839_16200 [Catenulispora yoronensis]|uniref:Uncharacterized protein n=1 Tax=Catenulispora yoronensis TaxID=450799 RepID=A0ABN2TU01_9ACTN